MTIITMNSMKVNKMLAHSDSAAVIQEEEIINGVPLGVPGTSKDIPCRQNPVYILFVGEQT